MCIPLYVTLIWCSGVPHMYGQFGGYICHGYMCILLYVKLIQCSNLFSVVVFQRAMVTLEAISVIYIYIYAFFYMWNLFGVVVFQRSMVDWGDRSASRFATSSAHMSSNSRNVKSATSSANMSSNSRNVKFPF